MALQLLAWSARRQAERRLNCRFPSVESAVARLAPRPWLMIHGGRDAYIGPEIARACSNHGKNPKELWLVPEAKHNRCRETAIRTSTPRGCWISSSGSRRVARCRPKSSSRAAPSCRRNCSTDSCRRTDRAGSGQWSVGSSSISGGA